MIGAIILQVVLIFLNAVFASAEIAVISANETKMQKMAEKGDKRASRLVKLTSQPAKFLSTIQVAITLAGFLGSAFAADNFAKPLVKILMNAGISIPESVVNSVCVVLITLILAYFNIVFGELIPKRIAMKKAEKMALGLSGILRFVSVLFAPIV
ncbi:MAG: CNNM domain-containing protein, partial [Coriobacteriales bacterium]